MKKLQRKRQKIGGGGEDSGGEDGGNVGPELRIWCTGIEAIADGLLDRGVAIVLITLGANGAYAKATRSEEKLRRALGRAYVALEDQRPS